MHQRQLQIVSSATRTTKVTRAYRFGAALPGHGSKSVAGHHRLGTARQYVPCLLPPLLPGPMQLNASAATSVIPRRETSV
jgi:hypothetical protein